MMSSNSGVDDHDDNSDRRQFGSGSREISCEQNIEEYDVAICANCGKGEEGSINLKSCAACMLVKYCSRDCQAAHRPHHKKECKRRAAELHEEALFEDVAPEECPICFLPHTPLENGTVVFMSCCGKSICSGCVYGIEMNELKKICPFCRRPKSTSEEEEVKRAKELIEKGNAEAFNHLGVISFTEGDYQKANELYLKGGELGCSSGYKNLGDSYYSGERGVERDAKKGIYYWELAAMKGDAQARYNLGIAELDNRNGERAVKHFLIAARAGDKASLDYVKKGFMCSLLTKDQYSSTLRAYQKIRNEMKSDSRDKAAELIP